MSKFGLNSNKKKKNQPQVAIIITDGSQHLRRENNKIKYNHK